jgi:surfactin synthase thioesterase subunit
MECHDLRSMSLAELAEFLRDLGGTPEEVLADQAMLESLQPTLGADFHLNEHYRYLDAPPLDIPVTAFSGTHDLGATPAYMTPWEKETTRRFVMHEIEGGHFSIFEHSNLVQSFIAEDLAISLTHR